MRFCQHNSVTGEHNFETFAHITSFELSNSGSRIAKPAIDKTICLLMEGNPQFTEDYFAHLVEVFNDSETIVAYSDFEVKSNFQLVDSHIRPPSWSPERFLSTDFLGPVIAVEISKFEYLKTPITRLSIVLACIENNLKVTHFAEIGYSVPFESFQQTTSSHSAEVKSFLDRNRPGSRIDSEISTWSFVSNKALAPDLISVIIPTRGAKKSLTGKPLVIECVSSLVNQKLGTSKLEILIVFDTDASASYLKKLKEFESEYVTIKFVDYDPPFNFSRKCNIGAQNASGEVLVFLNDDTLWRSEDSLLELAGTAMIQGIGAVGAKLFFENNRLQHAGYIYRNNFIGHAYFRDLDGFGPFGDLSVTHEVVGVTGACFAQKKDVWSSTGGWDEILPAAYNDVDYCFRIKSYGYSILQCNAAELTHYESITRNPVVRPEETALILDRWRNAMGEEPFFRTEVQNPEVHYLKGIVLQEYSRYIQGTFRKSGVKGVIKIFINGFKKLFKS
jgi:GT2 family glycosyltransferase